MAGVDELYSPGKHPKAHPEIMSPFVRANVAHPQMYGGMILRAGRVAYDLMLVGKLSVSTFSRSLPDRKQLTDMAQRAVNGHSHAGIDMPYLPNGGRQESDEGFLTPASLRGVYLRTRRGILQAIHSYALATVGLPLNAPDSLADERIFMAKKLLRPENRTAAVFLQTMWQTADNAARGRPIAEATAMMHRTFSSLPDDPKVRAAETALATRAARAAFNGLIVPALEQLKPEASNLLGGLVAEDVIDLFPFDVVHEGCDEFSDEYIENVRAKGRLVLELYE